jgi:hypothetical protein
VTSAWLSAAIQEFEQVTLDNGTELFRVQARAQRGDDPEPRPVLETREPDGPTNTYEPLSSGGDRRGLLRLAYAVPTERIGPSTAFSLRLPDGYRIELPEPLPGESGAEPEDGQQWQDAEPASDGHVSREPDDGAGRWIAELEQALSELRSSSNHMQRRLAELTAERDAARAEAESARAERDEALETAREQDAEHTRLTARCRQLEARIELLRTDATGARTGAEPRLSELESERTQIATHVRALAELLSTDEHTRHEHAGAELADSVADGAADRLKTIRESVVREANEQAERELRRLRAGTRR